MPCRMGMPVLYCEKGTVVLQGGSLPNLKKRGGGAYGNVFVSGFDSVCDIFNYTACLHR